LSKNETRSLIAWAIAVFGGFLAGVINTLAGNGSAITLSIFTEVLGLPPNMANGTNRVGILAQSITSSLAFHKHGQLKKDKILKVIWPFIPGAFLGVWVATHISNDDFRTVFGYLLIALLFVILIKPKRWLQADILEIKAPFWLRVIIFFCLGFYGGFIQMGMGIFFLACLVLIMKFNITESNAIKIFVVGVYTTFVLFIFHWQGLVDWKLGALVAIGQATGGYLTAGWASKYKWMEKVTYYLLIAIVVMVIGTIFW